MTPIVDGVQVAYESERNALSGSAFESDAWIFDTITASKDCNYLTDSKLNGQCIFGGECQTGNVIYKATFMLEGK